MHTPLAIISYHVSELKVAGRLTDTLFFCELNPHYHHQIILTAMYFSIHTLRFFSHRQECVPDNPVDTIWMWPSK